MLDNRVTGHITGSFQSSIAQQIKAFFNQVATLWSHDRLGVGPTCYYIQSGSCIGWLGNSLQQVVGTFGPTSTLSL